MIRVGEHYLRALHVRRIVAEAAFGVRRDPIGRAVVERLIFSLVVLIRHAHRMLLGQPGLDLLHRADDMILPLGRAGMRFVGDLVEQVVELVQPRDQPAQVGFLHFRHAFLRELMNLDALAVAVPVAVHAIDIIGGVHRMIRPRFLLKLHAVALEQHHRDVDARLTRLGETFADASEVVRVGLLQIELRFTIQRESRAPARIRLRRDEVVAIAPLDALHSGGVPASWLPGPATGKVVAVRLQPAKIGVEVDRLRRIVRADVDEIIPAMRAGQEDRLPRSIREVARILRMHPQRTMCLGQALCGADSEPQKQQRDSAVQKRIAILSSPGRHHLNSVLFRSALAHQATVGETFHNRSTSYKTGMHGVRHRCSASRWIEFRSRWLQQAD